MAENTEVTEYINRATEHIEYHDLIAAEICLLKAEEISNNPEITRKIAYFYNGLRGKRDQAFIYFRRLYRISEFRSEAALECGKTLYFSGQGGLAIKWLRRSLQSSMSRYHHHALYFMALIYSEMRRPERSIRYLNLALQYAPGYPPAEKLLGKLRENESTVES